MVTRTVKIKEIIVSERKRKVNQEHVLSLAESIKQIGLLNPVTLTNNIELVSGMHRLLACKHLGWSEIDAHFIGGNFLDYALAEIDENLIRSELTVLERADHLAERKRIYEEKFPETRRGNTSERNEVKRNNSVLPQKPTFSESSAEMLGVSQSTIQKEVSISERLSPEVKAKIENTAIADRKTDLLTLSKQTPEVQNVIADRINSGEISKVSQHFIQDEDFDDDDEPEDFFDEFDDDEFEEEEPETAPKVIDRDLEELNNDLINVLNAYKTSKSAECQRRIEIHLNIIRN